MLKNKTLEFKERYSTSVSTKQCSTYKRDSTPQYVKNKLNTTGFTNWSASTQNKLKTAKRMTKVQSTAHLKNRRTIDSSHTTQNFIPLKMSQNQTSLCRYLNFTQIRIEKDETKRQNFSETAQKSIIIQERHIRIKQVPNIQQFFNSLTPRSLFFCCKCYRYIFAIEKHLHHPKCENQIKMAQLNNKEKQRIGWQKLNIMLELSQYTKYKQKQIQKLFEQIRNEGKKEMIFNVSISDKALYLNFEEIEEAFIYTYQRLIKPSQENKSSVFSFKKLYECVEPKNLPSSKYQKKFFG